MKNKLLSIFIAVATLSLAGIAVFTAIRIYQLRNQSVSPAAPSSKPKAAIEPASCDVAFVVDRSGTMQNVEVGKTRIEWARLAATAATNKMIAAAQSGNIIKGGLTTFYYNPDINWAEVQVPTTAELATKLLPAVSNLNYVQGPGGGTCIACGISKATADLSSIRTSGSKQFIILLSDGKVARTLAGKIVTDSNRQEARAEVIQTASSTKTQNITVYVVGFGSGEQYDGDLLAAVASGSDKFYANTTADKFQTAFTEIISKACPGAPAETATPQPGICADLAFTINTPTATPTFTPKPDTPTPTASATPTSTPASCNNSCDANSDCSAGLVCSSGSCRNPSCTSKTDCVCETATPTPTATSTAAPVSCNNSCRYNSDCTSGLVCYSGMCRNPNCTTVTNCTCPVAAATPEPELPNAGSPLPTILGVSAGIILLVVSLALAL